jgi:hypothetical protein
LEARPLRAYVTPSDRERYVSSTGVARTGFRAGPAIGYVVTEASLHRGGAGSPGSELCPLSLLTRDVHSSRVQYATTSLADRSHKLASGWSLDGQAVSEGADGIAGFLWSKAVPGTLEIYRAPDESGRGYTLGWGAPGPGRAAIGRGFAVEQPTTLALHGYVGPHGVRYDATSAGGARWALTHGYRLLPSALYLLPDPALAVPYFEVSGPALSSSNRAIMLIHGGSWVGDTFTAFPVPLLPSVAGHLQTGGVDSIEGMTRRYANLGWTVYSVDYHSGGARALRELQAFHRSLRSIAPTARVCTAGASAGGHLALMLAARDPGISCVVALAAPTDLPALAAVRVSDAQIVKRGFGPESSGGWSVNSPVHALSGSRVPMLLATAADDPLVPYAQAAELARVLARSGPTAVQALELPPGPLGFVHGTTDAGAVELYLFRERCLLLQAATPGASCSSGPEVRRTPS